MKLGTLVGVLCIATLGLIGCGSSSSGSCTVNVAAANYSFCIAYIGSSYTSDSVKSACSAASGTYASGDCATGNGGSCDIGSGTSTEYKYTYTLSSGTDTSAEKAACTASGGTYGT